MFDVFDILCSARSFDESVLLKREETLKSRIFVNTLNSRPQRDRNNFRRRTARAKKTDQRRALVSDVSYLNEAIKDQRERHRKLVAELKTLRQERIILREEGNMDDIDALDQQIKQCDQDRTAALFELRRLSNERKSAASLLPKGTKVKRPKGVAPPGVPFPLASDAVEEDESQSEGSIDTASEATEEDYGQLDGSFDAGEFEDVEEDEGIDMEIEYVMKRCVCGALLTICSDITDLHNGAPSATRPSPSPVAPISEVHCPTPEALDLSTVTATTIHTAACHPPIAGSREIGVGFDAKNILTPTRKRQRKPTAQARGDKL
jgi:hypothetical protein